MRGAVIACALAGCTAAFGLHGVKDDDRDGDHIPDDVDNCPDNFNPDQSDIDGDGKGDACSGCASGDPTDSDGDGIPDACDGCDNRLPDTNGDGIPDACETINNDPCPMCLPCPLGGPRHDEDGDLITDTCDLCPTIASSDLTDADGDHIGAQCDIDEGIPHERIFDPFVTPNPAWYIVGPWMLENDQMVFAGPTADPNTPFMQLGSVGQDFTVETTLSGVTGGGALYSFGGVYAAASQDPTMAMEMVGCEIQSGPPTTLVLQFATSVFAGSTTAGDAGPPPWRLTLRYHKGSITCVVNGMATQPSTLAFNTTVWLPGIRAGGTAAAVRFNYFWAVSDVH